MLLRLGSSFTMCLFVFQTMFYAGNHTDSKVDMKKAKRMTVVYYRIKGITKINKGQYQVLRSIRLKVKHYLTTKKCGLPLGL